MSLTELRILDAFSRHLSTTISESRDLELLGQIENTVEAVADETVKYQSVALMMDHYLDAVQKANFSSIEALKALETAFAKASLATETNFNDAVARRQSAIDDARLVADDGIVEAYDALLEQLAATFNSVSQMAWILGEHIAESDKTLPGTFASADELFAAMGV